MPRRLNREEECERLLAHAGEDRFGTLMPMLERQFAVLHNRAQVLLGLCGIVITLTGFSGRLIADTNRAAQILIIGGVTCVLLATAIVVWGVLHLRWLTQQTGDTTREWLLTVLAYRDLKTRCYRIGIIFLLSGLAIYVGAIAIMLANPHPPALPVR